MSNLSPRHETTVQAVLQRDAYLRTHRSTQPDERRTPLGELPAVPEVVEAPKGSQRYEWQKRAVEEYERLLPTRRLELGADIVDRLLALTGHVIPSRNIYVDNDAHRAIANQDGSLFRLDRGRLVLLRPCAYCGTVQFESPEIHGPEGLGYALGHWHPLHEACGDDSSVHSADF